MISGEKNTSEKTDNIHLTVNKKFYDVLEIAISGIKYKIWNLVMSLLMSVNKDAENNIHF